MLLHLYFAKDICCTNTYLYICLHIYVYTYAFATCVCVQCYSNGGGELVRAVHPIRKSILSLTLFRIAGVWC